VVAVSNDQRSNGDFADRVQAEIERDAKRRLKEDPVLQRLEREVHESWVHVSPGAVAESASPLSLLEQVEQVSLVSVDAPTGDRHLHSYVKRTARKLVRWYFHYVVNQLNALHHYQNRLLREFNSRITRLEIDVGDEPVVRDLCDPVPEPEPALCELIATTLKSFQGSISVVSCGHGSLLEALDRPGVAVHGVEQNDNLVTHGINRGLDLRVGSPIDHLSNFGDSALAAVVLAGVVEHYKAGSLVTLLGEALRVTETGGVVVVAVADPRTRVGPCADLMQGLGLAPETWALLFEKHGCSVDTFELNGSRVESVVVARVS